MKFTQRVEKWHSLAFSVSLITVLVLTACGAAPTSAPESNVGITPENVQVTQTTEDAVTLNFALKAGEEEVVCGGSYAGIGSDPVSIQIKDARFYISNVHLINEQGESVSLTLTEDSKWQNEGITLLDFEDGSADCSEIGNADLNSEIKGTLPAGEYHGIVFDLGIPFELNHQDLVAAETPLNIPALWWNWQYGYKFARIDLATDAPAPDNQFFIHLGSTGCGEEVAMDMSAEAAEGSTAMTETLNVTETMVVSESMASGEESQDGGMDMGGMGATPPATACNNPNVVTVTLTDFNPTQNVIVADLATLLENVNVKQPVPQPAGCMAGVDDPDCQTLMPNFGLTLADGQCADGCSHQRLFRLE